MNPEVEQMASHAIATYQEARLAFEKTTSEVQKSLESCGWEWAAKDIAEYSHPSRYQYWLVSPEMYKSLILDEPVGFETPKILEEPDPKWIE